MPSDALSINVVMDEETRRAMTQFWQEHSQDASVEEMMLDSEATHVHALELDEVLGLLGDVTGLDVLELGSGIGRYTGELANKAKSVKTVDFMGTFVEENKKTNGHHANVIFQQGDVTQLTCPEESFDLIFSNWLLMYLNDEEVHSLFAKMLSWLRPGGKLFFRESCFHQSGDKSRKSNPTHYREPATYNSLFQAPTQEANNGYHAFELIFSKSIQTYIQIKNNPNQICWLVEKVRLTEQDTHGFKTFQQFLDQQQYSRNGILRYERIFGRNYVSTGGKETTQEFVALLDLQPGQKVLDVGAGIGGSAFYMAQEYDVQVLGIDLSSNMIGIAMERANELKDSRVQFEVADATKRSFEEGAFDVVYSRDTILHIADKKTLFESFLRWLKPGGKLLISDYCCHEKPWSPEYTSYVAQRGYNLLTPQQYGQVLEEAGFTQVRAEDRTEQFVSVLKKELAKFEPIKESFTQEFSAGDYEAIVDGWNDKLHRCGLGDQKWGLFYAEKPGI